MVALHVDLQLQPGAGPELEKTFCDVFRPAISAQPGFSGVALLHSTPEADHYRLVIEFQSEELRLDWVATASPSAGVAEDGSPLRQLFGEELHRRVAHLRGGGGKNK